MQIWRPRKTRNNELWRQTATDRARNKTKSLGLDRPHVEETRWTCNQEGNGVETTGEAKERETTAHL